MPEFIKEMFGKITQTNIPTFIAVVIAAPLLEEWLIREVALKGMLQHMAPHQSHPVVFRHVWSHSHESLASHSGIFDGMSF